MGKVMRAGLNELPEKHPSVGEVRGTGLLQVIELVRNRHTREPKSGWNQPPSDVMSKVAAKLRELGVNTFVKRDWIFWSPPLVVTEEQLQEGLDIIGQALQIADRHCEI